MEIDILTRNVTEERMDGTLTGRDVPQEVIITEEDGSEHVFDTAENQILKHTETGALLDMDATLWVRPDRQLTFQVNIDSVHDGHEYRTWEFNLLSNAEEWLSNNTELTQSATHE